MWNNLSKDSQLEMTESNPGSLAPIPGLVLPVVFVSENWLLSDAVDEAELPNGL
jgi:hypothetical protein